MQWVHLAQVLFILFGVGFWINYKWNLARQKKRGYIIEPGGGAEDMLIYYREGENSIYLYGERKDGFVIVPSNAEWERSMPEWAKGRKGQIMERIYADYTYKGRLAPMFREEE